MIATSLRICAASRAWALAISSSSTCQRCSRMKRCCSLSTRARSLATSRSCCACANASSLSMSSIARRVSRLRLRTESAVASDDPCRSSRAASSRDITPVVRSMSATWRACSLAMSTISLSVRACSRASSLAISTSSSSFALSTSAMRRSRSARSSASLRWMLASCSSSVFRDQLDLPVPARLLELQRLLDLRRLAAPALLGGVHVALRPPAFERLFVVDLLLLDRHALVEHVESACCRSAGPARWRPSRS